jgi:mycofactocin precursor
MTLAHRLLLEPAGPALRGRPGRSPLEAAARSAARRAHREEQNLEIESLEEKVENGKSPEANAEEPGIVDDICVEELAIDGICGVY